MINEDKKIAMIIEVLCKNQFLREFYEKIKILEGFLKK